MPRDCKCAFAVECELSDAQHHFAHTRKICVGFVVQTGQQYGLFRYDSLSQDSEHVVMISTSCPRFCKPCAPSSAMRSAPPWRLSPNHGVTKATFNRSCAV